MKTRQFTDGERCSKVEIYNCFYGQGSRGHEDGLRSSDVVRARAYIGRNVPYRMCQAGHAEEVEIDGELHWKLTMEGRTWLTVGLKRYLKNRPDRVHDLTAPARRVLKTVANNDTRRKVTRRKRIRGN